MNTEHDTQAQEPIAPALEAGTLLKNQREALGLTQKQISDRLKLRISLIQQIEENQFESDQVATFMRGYIRSYAKYVNLDEKVVLNALRHSGDAPHEDQTGHRKEADTGYPGDHGVWVTGRRENGAGGYDRVPGRLWYAAVCMDQLTVM